MTIVALQGLHGGVGTTCTAVALGWALHRLGKRVLVVDANPGDQVSMHFNLPLSERGGWASAYLSGGRWQETAWRYAEGLDFLPFGALAVEQLPALEASLQQPDGLSAFTALRDAYDWIVLDIGSGEHALTRQMAAWSELLMVLVVAEANCHVRLHRQALPREAHLLVTQLVPTSVLQEDIYLLWQQTLPALIPLVLHRDEAMAEAAASKQPVGEFAPHSLVAQEITNLAAWCLLQALAGPNGDKGGQTL
ncbi:cellulose synthase operon protein YhjQ [Edwardsiella hoshinae]|uniref:Cell division protein n=1 Tax=Edwardsiella hoshinae TaxID=93378 RepID=A0A376D5P1_9GAMM|nr:cellulose biosynthesis protein BcsQ [Edwardsiella hoshinae]AOV95573.1 cellulose synthase operon protein YhjQ [Edwardsiella hoshinae]QPR28584.1 cellulose synthase operon protein YhjQ [Edwardsiella hoshinae]STC82730.1 cell division protein [Edwardsiella hoshinae]